MFIARGLEQIKKKKLAGIMFFLLCILFLISQISFLIFPDERYNNLGGLFGHYSSLGLFWLIGFYFLIVPIILGYLGYISLFQEEKKPTITLLYLIPSGVIIDTLLSLFVHIDVIKITSGGMLGSIINTFLLDYFGAVGTYLILGFSILILIFMMVKEKIFHRPMKIEGAAEQEKVKKQKIKKEKKAKEKVEAQKKEDVQKIERKP
ncbi:hypothetical protein AMJ52_09250, partial [candidate division TA06 bacterium DG_78]